MAETFCILSIDKLKRFEFRERKNLDHKIKIIAQGEDFITYLIDGKNEISIAIEEGYVSIFTYDLEEVYNFINRFEEIDELDDDYLFTEEW